MGRPPWAIYLGASSRPGRSAASVRVAGGAGRLPSTASVPERAIVDDRQGRPAAGARRGAAHRRRVRRGVRGGQAVVVGQPRRRQGRAGHLGPGPGRRHPGGQRRDHRLRPHRRPQPRPACWPRPKPPRPRPRARAAAGPSVVALTARPAPPGERRGDRTPRRVGKAGQGRAARCGPTTPPAATGAAIVQVSAGYGDSRKRILVANSDGLLADDDQVRTLFRVSVVASGDTGMQTGYESLGHTIGFELFDQHDVEELARRAAQRALTKLNARPAPSGSLPVVIKPGQRRRAVPRGLRPRARGRPRRQGRVGVQGPGRRAGGRPHGHAGRRRHHVRRVGRHRHRRRGPCRRSATSSSRTACSPTTCGTSSGPARRAAPQRGNGRRQSYMHLPMVRMTNTFVLDGDEDPDEIVRATDHGVYVAQLGGGQVNTATRRLRVRDDRGLPDRERRDHRPHPGGQPHRQRPPGAAGHRPARQRLRHGHRPARAARTARACRSATASRRCGSRPSPSVARRPERDDADAWTTSLELADGHRRPSGAAASRSRPTSARAKRHRACASTRARSSTSRRPRPRASASGSSRDGRVGFAYAGTLDARRRGRGAGRGPRQRRPSARPTSGPGWPRPTAWRVRRARPVARGAAGAAHRRQDRAGQGARAAHPGRRQPGAGRGGRLRRRPRPRARSPPAPASPPPAGRPAAYLVGQHAGRRRRRDPDRLRLHASAARRATSTSRRRPGEAAERATRLLGATKPTTARRDGGARPVRHRRSSSASSAPR